MIPNEEYQVFGIDIILKYFPDLTDTQILQFNLLCKHFTEKNSFVNMISRKDTEHLFERHILHSLSIAKYTSFFDGAQVMDLGTGGGFPALPLAIIFPNVQFIAVDSIAKKIKVVEELIQILSLSNLTAKVARAESLNEKFDYVVTRAVALMSDLHKWTLYSLRYTKAPNLPSGIIALKGGDLTDELLRFERAKTINLSDFYEEPFFETKKIIYLARF